MFSSDSLDKSLKVHLSLRALGDENDGINDSKLGGACLLLFIRIIRHVDEQTQTM